MEHRDLAVRPGKRAPNRAYQQSYPLPRNPKPPREDSSDDDALALLEYWRILRRRRATLAWLALLGLFAGVILTVPQTPLYRARATLEIQNMNSDFLNKRQISPVADDPSMNVLTDVSTQMKIIQSEQLVWRVISKLGAEGKLDPLLEPKGRFYSIRKFLIPIKISAPGDYTVRQAAMNNMTIRQLGQTRVIEVLYSSSDPQFASDFVNTLATEYIESNMEARWKMSERTGQWLSGQLNEMRDKLERSEAELQDYAQRAGLLFAAPLVGSPTDKTNVSEEKLRQLQEELSKAQDDRAAAQSRYEVATSAPPDTLGDVLNDQSLRELQEQLTDLRGQEARLSSIYTPKHENVKMVQAQIKPLEAEFEKERAAIVRRIRNDYDAALRREKLLTADYGAQSQIVTDQTSKSIQYNILKREADSNRRIYESVLQQVKEASVASAMRASNIRIVDPGSPPLTPYSPNLKMNAVLGLLCGLMLGVAIVLLRDRADCTLQQPGDSKLWANVPELGAIPSASLADSSRHYTKLLPAAGDSGQTAPPLFFGPNRQTVELMTWNSKPSAVAEAFRTVLTSILFVGSNGSRPKVLVLTSGGPGDGKTTVTSNLGIAMAEIRRKVLLIDADLRRPRLHDLFSLPNEQGLSTILRDDHSPNGSLDKLIHRTHVPNLEVLTGGPATSATARLLHSPHLSGFLARLKCEYDLVLIDTPPSLQVTDARLIGRLADAVVLVARVGKTTREALVALNQRFFEDRIPVLGAVLNDWDPRNSPNGYYGYRGDVSYRS